jgi:serine/threonine protein kinase
VKLDGAGGATAVNATASIQKPVSIAKTSSYGYPIAISVSDFELLRRIGRGAFGEVRKIVSLHNSVSSPHAILRLKAIFLHTKSTFILIAL